MATDKKKLYRFLKNELFKSEKLKLMERDKKFVLKGKKVIYDYPITSKHKLKIKKIQNVKNESNNDIEVEYSFSDEDEKNKL